MYPADEGVYLADEGVYLACVSGQMGTGIWASGLGGRFRERAWRPGYGDIGMGIGVWGHRHRDRDAAIFVRIRLHLQRKGFSASSRDLRQRKVLFFVPLALSENLSSPLEAALVLYSFHSLLNENHLCFFGSLKTVLLCL